MNNYEKLKEKYNHFGELSCYFSNGHKCTHPCLEHCKAYDDIDKLEDIEDEICMKEHEIIELENARNGLAGKILQLYQEEV